QQTIQKSLSFTGTGLHSGAEVTMTFHPAGVNAGICFVRSDVADRDNHVPALWDRVVDTRLCTVLGNEAGVTVGTVEHLMAALRGCGIDNLVIALDGPEVPIMDGSAAPFIEKIDEAGLKKQTKPRRAIRILKDIVWEEDGKRAVFRPADSFVFQGEIAFDHPEIGRQERTVSLVNGAFREEIANARTFGFAHEVAALRQAGLALGGS
ncbi:MAG: UDP-3-O-[3-hydroxymyristoyl] N-acetylglucosamine deacetylase, partial [Gammaproteobacteria bacterium]|nr:UDP-3-O-[3-hydroxymyristoyl] N-acetylglucosamine deacetylase [Gammaproteobacteria bacterium]